MRDEEVVSPYAEPYGRILEDDEDDAYGARPIRPPFTVLLWVFAWFAGRPCMMFEMPLTPSDDPIGVVETMCGLRCDERESERERPLDDDDELGAVVVLFVILVVVAEVAFAELLVTAEVVVEEEREWARRLASSWLRSWRR